MWSVLDLFKTRIRKGDEVAFYFAGHGVQVGANAMLLPTDIDADSDEQLLRDGVGLADVQEELTDARFALLIIDACRDNPFPPSPGHARSIGDARGLALIEPAAGNIILMAASRGQTALDGVPGVTAQNGLFTYTLVKAIKTPGVDILTLVRGVRDDVEDQAKRANHKQRPGLVDEMRGQFLLFPVASSNVLSPPAAPPAVLTKNANPPTSNLNQEEFQKSYELIKKAIQQQGITKSVGDLIGTNVRVIKTRTITDLRRDFSACHLQYMVTNSISHEPIDPTDSSAETLLTTIEISLLKDIHIINQPPVVRGINWVGSPVYGLDLDTSDADYLAWRDKDKARLTFGTLEAATLVASEIKRMKAKCIELTVEGLR